MKPILPTLKLLIVALCLFSLNFNPQQGLSVGQSAYAATYVAPPRQAVVTHMSKLARLNAFELAIRTLINVSVGTVEWVMDEKNTSVRWKRPPSSVGDPEGEKHCRRIAKERGFEYGMTERVEFDGKLAYFKCFNPYLNSYGSYSPELEGVLTFNQIADQMIVNAVTGNKDSQNALDIVKRAMTQANAPKPPLKPSVVVTQPKPTQPKPTNPPAKPITTPKPTNPPAKPANPPKPVEPITSQHGTNNNPDTRIVQDWTHTTERDANGNKPDRCTWLAQNKHKYPKDAVKVTEKAWKCRRSRASKDGK